MIERHHLFPKGYLKKLGSLRPREKPTKSPTYAYVEWGDNAAISDQAPAEYLRQLELERSFSRPN